MDWLSVNRTDIIRLEMPANYRSLRILSACIAGLLEPVEHLADQGTIIYSIQLAVHETCANIIDHAYAGNPEGRITVSLMLEPQPRRVVVELYDTGRAFDFAGIEEPNLDELQERGYGLFLIRNLMDEVTYSPFPTNNLWRLVKYL